jgi:hypothetical protein
MQFWTHVLEQEFWRLTVSASLACQVMINWYIFQSNRLALLIESSNTIDWDSPKGDLIKRAYWHCVLMETCVYPSISPRANLI